MIDRNIIGSIIIFIRTIFMENMNANVCEHCGCKCPHHKVVPGLVVLFGLAFLLEALGYMTMQTLKIVWPALVVLAGFTKWGSSRCKCC